MRFKHFPALGLAAALAAAGCSPSGGQEPGASGPALPPAEVNVVAVEPRDLPFTLEYVGQTAGSREVEVRARVTGILLSRNFEEGARVERGQSLFTIDPAPYEAAAARAAAEVAAAQARLAQAKRNLARLKPLYQAKQISPQAYDDAVSAEAIAAADVKAAQAREDEARLSLGYTKVRSPLSGITGRALRSEGSLVSGPEVLLTTVVRIDPIWVNFGIPDAEQIRLRREAATGRLRLPETFEVQLRLADGSLYERTGKLAFANVSISPATGTHDARAEVPNPDGMLRPGQFVRVILRGAIRPAALTVPQRAVLEGPKGKFVYVVNDKSQAEPRPIEAGDWSKDGWIILSGLAAGDRVISDGVMKIAPGAPVRIAKKN